MSRHARTTLTCSCGQPVNGTTLCRGCVRTVDVALTNIAAYYADLEAVETGQRGVRYDLPRGKGGTRSVPLPFDNRFVPGGTGDVARATARNTITTWVRVCLEEWPALTTRPRDTIASCCAYLQGLLSRIAVTLWADELKRDVLDLERTLLRVDAGRAERLYAGECLICLIFNDHTPMYAHPGDEWVTCRDCGAEYRVEDRRNLMLDALEYEWLTAARIADQAAYLGRVEDRDWAAKKINRWHSDGFLAAAGTDDQDRPVFPFGDVCRLLVAAESRRRSATPRSA